MTAPTPRDTGPALDPRAVKAAAEALHRYTCDCGIEDDEEYRDTAEVALTAAAPFLRAEGAAAERQRIAALLYAEAAAFRARNDMAGWWATDRAARIAEADLGTTAPTEGDDRD